MHPRLFENKGLGMASSLILVTLFGSAAFPSGGQDIGGGSECVAEFMRTAFRISEVLDQAGNRLKPHVTGNNFLDAIDASDLKETSSDLRYHGNPVDAYFDGNVIQIRCDRFTHDALDGRERVVAHEQFRKMGLEGDKYELSRQIFLPSEAAKSKSIPAGSREIKNSRAYRLNRAATSSANADAVKSGSSLICIVEGGDGDDYQLHNGIQDIDFSASENDRQQALAAAKAWKRAGACAAIQDLTTPAPTPLAGYTGPSITEIYKALAPRVAAALTTGKFSDLKIVANSWRLVGNVGGYTDDNRVADVAFSLLDNAGNQFTGTFTDLMGSGDVAGLLEVIDERSGKDLGYQYNMPGRGRWYFEISNAAGVKIEKCGFRLLKCVDPDYDDVYDNL